MRGVLQQIVLQPVGRKYEEGRFGDFIREPVPGAMLVADFGLEGDQKARRNSNRQVNLLAREWLDRLAPLGFRTAPGQFGEQMIVAGIPFDAVQPGDRFRLGATAVIEITMPRHGCTRLEAAQGRPTQPECGHIGLLARVVTGGPIQAGDPIERIAAAADHAADPAAVHPAAAAASAAPAAADPTA
jgi:MOSC domain-containing protein YiiM